MANIGDIQKLLTSGNVKLLAAPEADKDNPTEPYVTVTDIDYTLTYPEDRIDYAQDRDYYYATADVELSFSVRGSVDFANELAKKADLPDNTNKLTKYRYQFEITDTNTTRASSKKLIIKVDGYMMSHSVTRRSNLQNDPVTIRCRIRVTSTAVGHSSTPIISSGNA